MQAWSWGVAQFICLPGMCSVSTRILCICCAYVVHIFCAYFVHICTSYDGALQGHLSYDFEKLPRSTTESRASTTAKEVQDCGDKNVLEFIGERRVTNVSWRHNLFYSAKASTALLHHMCPDVEHDVEHVQFQSHLFQLQRVRCLRPVFGCSTECRVPPMGRQIHDAK